MFRNGRFKPGKSQINGRLKPQMLAAERRQLAHKNQQTARKQKPKIVLKDLSVYEPHININLGNLRIPMLLLLLILLPQVFADPNIRRILIDGINVHGKSVALLPPDADCRDNPVGVSKGSICKFDGKTHYIKPLKPSESRKTRHLSYQVFNHQLAESTLGIKTAGIRFFKKDDNETSIYIASEHVNDIKFIQERNGVSKLKPSDAAKWAVASTFIYDLHSKNVGYTDEGIVALDLDGHNRPLTNDLFTNMMTAAHTINIHTPWLSLDNIRQMKQMYLEMRHKPLPEHHHSFDLTNEMYQDMLSAYINICDNVIAAHETTIPATEHASPDSKINQLWCQTAKEKIPSHSQSDNKFYGELCLVKTKPKAAEFGFINRQTDTDRQVKSKPKGNKFRAKKIAKNAENSGSSFSP